MKLTLDLTAWPCGIVSVHGVQGREIESRQGIHRADALNKKTLTLMCR
jgi:hypothetical protein